jgi:hypothetical protein
MTSPLERCQWSSLPQLSGNTKRNRSEEQQQEKEEKKRSCLISRRWLERTSSWSSPSSPCFFPSLLRLSQLNSTVLFTQLQLSSAECCRLTINASSACLRSAPVTSPADEVHDHLAWLGHWSCSWSCPLPPLCTVPLCSQSTPSSPPLIFLSSSCPVPVCQSCCVLLLLHDPAPNLPTK